MSLVPCIAHYDVDLSTNKKCIKMTVNYSKMKVLDQSKRSEKRRLKTLKDYPQPKSYELAPRMAKAGLYHSRKDGQIKCAFCQGIFDDCRSIDNVIKRHKHQYPLCPFMLNLDVGNKPIMTLTKTEYPNEEPDFKHPKELNVVRYDCEEEQSVLSDALKESISEWRDGTFGNYPKIRGWSSFGLFIKEFDGISEIRCFKCSSETEVLDEIEDMGWTYFHKRSCPYVTNTKDQSDIVGGSEKPCSRVEYGISNNELELRVDFLTSKLIEKSGQKFDAKLIKSQIKSRREETDLLYDLLVDLRVENSSCQSEDEDMKLTRFVLEEYSCVVCLDKPIEDIHMPCGHFKTCKDCSSKLSNCPVCRGVIERRISRVRFPMCHNAHRNKQP